MKLFKLVSFAFAFLLMLFSGPVFAYDHFKEKPQITQAKEAVTQVQLHLIQDVLFILNPEVSKPQKLRLQDQNKKSTDQVNKEKAAQELKSIENSQRICPIIRVGYIDANGHVRTKYIVV